MFWRTVILLALGIGNVAIFSRMLWGPTGLMEYNNLKNQYNFLQAKIAALDAKNLALSREIRLLQSDTQYAEKVVRQKLHYLRDNELVYIFDKLADGRPGVANNDRKN